ncbi:MAG: hypothetical protein DLM69_10645, partial [Candidatus Chloroheliales bacterium]
MGKFNRRWRVLLLTVTICSAWLAHPSTNQTSVSQSQVSKPAGQPAASAAKLADLSKLPLSFVPNVGQFDPQVHYVAHGPGYTLFLTDHEAVLSVANPTNRQSPSPSTQRSDKQGPATPRTNQVIRYQWRDANAKPKFVAENKLTGKSNYFIGNDHSKWHSDVPSYGRVNYKSVYPGIELSYYGGDGGLEYDFNVSPGADPSRIHLAITGADKVELEADGLVLHTRAGDLRQRVPHIYQEGRDGRVDINGGYQLLADGSIGFTLAAYDPKLPLTIDPTLDYSSYLGGGGGDAGDGVAVDNTGFIYLAGSTGSIDFPTAGNPFQPHNAGRSDVFISKLSPDGSQLVYSTYLGGSNNEGELYLNFPDNLNLAVDGQGQAYVTGATRSHDFPTYHAIQPAFGGGHTDAFVTKLAASGSTLIYSTYLGGSGDEEYDGQEAGTTYRAGIAADSQGNTYITGETSSPDFPTYHAIQPSFRGYTDAFVTKLNPDGSAFVYSTYLGGSTFNWGYAITADTQGNAYIAGKTNSPDFPIYHPFQQYHYGTDAFITKLTADGSAFGYSTYLGGQDGEDQGYGIAVDSAGSVYVTGETNAIDFPTRNPYQPSIAGSADAFLTKMTPDGSDLVYSTYLGGSGSDYGLGLAVGPTGDAYVVGMTLSADFPLRNPLQPYGGHMDGFVTRFNTSGTGLLYSTYLGGSWDDVGQAVAVDSAGAAYVAGWTGSTDFPTHNALQSSLDGVDDAFIAKIAPLASDNPTATPTVTGTPPTATATSSATAAPPSPTPTVTGTPPTATPTATPCGPDVYAPWNIVAPSLERYESPAVATDGQLAYSAGGFTFQRSPATSLNQFSSYDPRTNTWAALNSMPDANDSAAAAYDPVARRLYVFGGEYNNNGGFTYRKTRIYDFATQNWSYGSDMPDGRMGMAAGYWKGKVYLVAGSSDYVLPAHGQEQTWEYDIQSATWLTKTSVPARLGFSYSGGAVINGHLYVVGGEDTYGIAQKALWDYDIAGDTWTRRADLPTATGEFGPTVVNHDERLWVYGGEDQYGPADGETVVYNPDTDSWRNGPPLNQVRYNAGGASVGPYVVAIGGNNAVIGQGSINTTEVSFNQPNPCLSPTPSATPTHTATVTPTMTPNPRLTSTATTTFVLPTHTPPPSTGTPALPTNTPTDCPNRFLDVNGNVFYTAIHALYCRGVINGTDPTHYSPSGASTRAQFAKVVVLGFGLPFYTPSGTPEFSDVPASYFAYLYIETGFHAGILSGFDAAGCTAHGATYPCYLPNIPITRGQLTKLVVGAAHYPLYTPTGGNPTFSDVPASNVFFVSIETAHYKGVINGYPDGT